MLKCLARVVAVVALASPAAAQAIRTVPVNASDLAYSPSTGRLYASVSGSGVITEIDPVAGTVVTSFAVGSQPNKLAVSTDGDYLFVGLDGLPGVVRVHLPTRTVGTPFALGTPDPTFGARLAQDIAAVPGNNDAIAVARRFVGFSPEHAGVAIYDAGVARAATTSAGVGSNLIEFGATGARLFGYSVESGTHEFSRLDVGVGGVTVADATQNLFSALAMEYRSGRVFGNDGTVVDAENRTVVTKVADFNQIVTQVEPDATRVYYLTSFDTVSWVIRAYATSTLAIADEWSVPGVTGTARTLVSVGAAGLAFATSSGQVFLVNQALLPQGAPFITITSPTTNPATGADAMSVTLGGVTSDPDDAVAAVAWSTDRGYSGTASGTAQWYASDIPLVLGTNLVTVTATDGNGNSRSDTLAVTASSYTSLLAEGATGDFFDYDLLLANPTTSSATVTVTYLKTTGPFNAFAVTLPPQSRRTIRVDDIPGLEATTVATTVNATTAPIVAERTMRWGLPGVPQYGAHSDKATPGPAVRWYFAEGSQGFFFTYLLLANTDGLANTATIDWLIEGAAPVQRTLTLAPYSRTTVDAGADAALVNRSFGIVVTFARPAVAERAMYFGTDPLFKAGHDSAGVTAPSTRWVLAEGATGPFFETFILLANPNATPADATLRFLTSTGAVVDRTVTIPASGRRTVNVEALSPAAPELANAAVATLVTASLPIVAERAQYWPGPPSSWYEAHNSFGLTAARTRWGLAEGRVGNPPGVPAADYQTYILLANPGVASATATVTFLRESGAPVVRTFTVPGESRVNVAVAGQGSTVPELANEMFGALIEATQPIVVERALYGNAGAQVFDMGTNATATPLP